MRLKHCVCLLLLATLPGLSPAQSFEWQAGDRVIGTPTWTTTEYEDTFASIGEEHGFGFLELVRANPEVDPWLPGDGTRIRLPSRHLLPSGPHEGIVINLAEYRLYHFRGGQVVTYPVGIGNTNNPSPLTRTSIRMRLESPAWYPPESIRTEARNEGNPLPAVIPPGPANPLGPFALQLEEDGYLIHGTNKRFGVGQQVSHGCIRMFNDHIEELVWEVEKGSSVRIVEEPVKTAVSNGTVWLQIHGQRESLTESDRDELWRKAEKATQRVRDRHPGVEINRKRLLEAVEQADGIARRVGMVTGISPG
ncbi:L,D-transpeptidase ErfK/SrfK [Halospina denitrificans]|uniref:L,D-transpeptidase ErfK/SrfK n=1 Tax=Halospina denitrificans TaxID=332522 RepID=A0A4R7K033_9GAMM|nr:L,D-transpeptidase family protein [Halospina denitrificans]TDT44172.1 L,D-transpeptidase ErfK/SrfK [Halospina denitrificans]